VEPRTGWFWTSEYRGNKEKRRFHLPGDGKADIVAMSHNGFVVGTAEEFLALQKAVVATDPGKPHPWPIEEFLGTLPRAPMGTIICRKKLLC